ncbi:MAG TPA: glycoside hydrolase family 16 protein [Prolixibacteraceae bacterium]|nr:glycoside hydrolase family 16 protein [Prolixibacteraceae bacterium]HPS13228.1 glycoside hydrolase family 16 protein [Prolixibacteraceae bacterium]
METRKFAGKWMFWIVVSLLFFAACKNPNQSGIKCKKNYKLVWSDEFNYNGLPDSAKWSYDTTGNAWGWGNNELQCYTSAQLKNAEVSNGTLKIKAIKEDISGFHYTSARLVTKQKGDWLYGRFEISARLPEGRGLWPAIWMLPTDWKYGGWPNSGEIDIMENVGYDPTNIVASIHTSNYNHKAGTQRNHTIEVKDNRSAFHTYAMEWDEKQIRTFVDDSLYFSFNKEANDFNVWPFDQRFHLLLNLAVGGDWGGHEGVNDSIFPTTMEIDYVRVFQKQEKNK